MRTVYTICSVGRAESCLPIWEEQRLHIGKVSIARVVPFWPPGSFSCLASPAVKPGPGIVLVLGIVLHHWAALQRCQEAGALPCRKPPHKRTVRALWCKQGCQKRKRRGGGSKLLKHFTLPLNFLKQDSWWTHSSGK